MSGSLLRWACAATVASMLAAPGPATAATATNPAPLPAAGGKSVATLLTDLQRLYQEAEKATETYNATAEKLKKRQKTAGDLARKLATARTSLHDSRDAAGRLAREQYQGSSNFSPYVRLLLARDPQHALDQGHVIRRVAQERIATVDRLVGGEKRADDLAARARKALSEQTRLSDRQKKDRDAVRARLKDVEKLLASLSADQLAELTRLEDTGMAKAQKTFMASGALSSRRAPSRAGDTALAYAVQQIGKPYVWGAEGPAAFDCSGLTSKAWEHAGEAIPRTSQEQWARLPRVPLNALRPGDLVVYFPEATHVAMYLGDGMVVQAPRPGAKVKVSPIAANPLLGAVRPDQGATSMKDYTPPKLPGGATGGDDTGNGAAGAPTG
ncbi:MULTISPECIES: NlpC/P60 family protein [unclassified Streptomyces]|uniref:NlpC/P60 family protein n=1 Tax=Streptomyces sp. NBC_00119 TaxID=2975659 RepID=A0AAU1U969_9ACTN|nr:MULTISPECIES: NlpC/P60 family protein [unclassified Streptomyces]MCX4643224.1 NlpC/P60 family protein [Streptomyces sp. NBC_01446]MCX5324346.1 NlpC/P60 family protein [Streptomyces sp. NBC_00120]